ncbi:unnamed protein product [Urochloa humidicola]
MVRRRNTGRRCHDIDDGNNLLAGEHMWQSDVGSARPIGLDGTPLRRQPLSSLPDTPPDLRAHPRPLRVAAALRARPAAPPLPSTRLPWI